MKRFEYEDACIKCSLCVTACPVYRVDQQFPGPKALGPDWYRHYQAGEAKPMEHVSDCTFCQLCESACPVDVPIAHLIAVHKELASQSPRLAVRDYLLTHPQWLAMVPSLVKLPKQLGVPLGISSSTQWPAPSPLQRSRRHRTHQRQGSATRRIGIFVDCFTRGFDSETLLAASAVLEELGYTAVPLPSASHCCGAAAYASGLLGEAERTARSTHRAVRRMTSGLEAVVTLNATCDDTLRVEWPRYFGLTIPVPILPFVDFVLDRANPGFFERIHGLPGQELIYTHATCRSKVARGEGSLFALMERVSERPPQILEISCCGAAGSYAFKTEHTKVARALGHRAKEVMGEPGIILTDSGTCAIHLQELTGCQTIHPARWLHGQLKRQEVLR
ncbi:heterodisulfide reductase-related iron-sulfur binding cluster [Ferrimicrobium sp.]|uniref:heterodisulfide reductase-related iron-sulfur binding cluster n=1 Tax=Ferrimicrobium sp. TaxID=2926050 RepID=UPI0026292059|nr:heterodisulfide reductase-related iron-sulfur binding cluster [Ferrimicrobium sp.]